MKLRKLPDNEKSYEYQKRTLHLTFRGGPHGVMVKTLDCNIVVSEFILQSHYYVHF